MKMDQPQLNTRSCCPWLSFSAWPQLRRLVKTLKQRSMALLHKFRLTKTSNPLDYACSRPAIGISSRWAFCKSFYNNKNHDSHLSTIRSDCRSLGVNHVHGHHVDGDHRLDVRCSLNRRVPTTADNINHREVFLRMFFTSVVREFSGVAQAIRLLRGATV